MEIEYIKYFTVNLLWENLIISLIISGYGGMHLANSNNLYLCDYFGRESDYFNTESLVGSIYIILAINLWE